MGALMGVCSPQFEEPSTASPSESSLGFGGSDIPGSVQTVGGPGYRAYVDVQERSTPQVC
jgi:hypothetical protein